MELTQKRSWLFVCVDDPAHLQSASGIFARSMLSALGALGEVELLVVPGLPNHRRWLRRLNQGASLILNRSALEGTVDARKIQNEVLRAAEQSPGRPIFLNHLRSACFLAHSSKMPGAPIIYVAQNSEPESARSLGDLVRNPIKRWILRREASRIADLEARVTRKVSHVVTLTDEDAARFHTTCPVTCLPPLLEPESIPSAIPNQLGDGNTIGLISSFDWAPKRWNAHWIMDDVMPLVWAKQPQVRLLVAGAGANKLRIKHVAVDIESDVPDIRYCYHRADLIIVPDRQKSGLKFKTVQAALAGKAIVSTAPGIEGTGLQDGESVLVRSSAEEFSEAIVQLIVRPAYRASLGHRARAVAQERFSRIRILNQFGTFLEQLEGNNCRSLFGEGREATSQEIRPA